MFKTQKNDRATWLKGPGNECCMPPEQKKRPWRLVLLGAPGVGKGTQAQMLAERLGSCHLSTGDVFRAAKEMPACECGAAMTAALSFMRKGELVPDTTVVDMVRERRGCLNCGGGFLLDGFPRTVAQAQALEALLAERSVALDGVLDFQLPQDEIVARLAGRRTCGSCKAVFHLTDNKPRQEGICDKCHGRLIQREDDRPEAILVRMEAYASSTAPLTDYYEERGLLVPVAANGSPADVFSRAINLLWAHAGT